MNPYKIWVYRVLVSHEQVPKWEEKHIRSVATQEHLYTRLHAGKETDTFEKMLSREFEDPAEVALNKATSDKKLTCDDWKSLINFLAAQHLRTPTRLEEYTSLQHKALPNIINESILKTLSKPMNAHQNDTPVLKQKIKEDVSSPFKVSITKGPDDKQAFIHTSTLIGRTSWLEAIEHMRQYINQLIQHRWTILSPPEDICWITCDDPVIALNYEGPDQYDFHGGWKKTGTDIFLPLGPKHLLYTQVGNKKMPKRGTVVPNTKAVEIRNIIAKRAHRMIFSHQKDPDIPIVRPRTVDAKAYKYEKDKWDSWHPEQTSAERDFMGWDDTD